jgi:chromosomal replication initiation ATPase DnaA
MASFKAGISGGSAVDRRHSSPPPRKNRVAAHFNALQADGRQIVMTSDRSPTEIRTSTSVHYSAFRGLIVDMGAPITTRMATSR